MGNGQWAMGEPAATDDTALRIIGAIFNRPFILIRCEVFYVS